MLNPFEILQTEILELKTLMSEMKETIKSPEPKPQIQYLNRKDVSELLKISISSVINWEKNGVLKGYQISNKIYYKLDEIEEAMTLLRH